MASFTWTGPFRIKDLLSRCLDDGQPWPPAAEAVYLVSRNAWTDAPTDASVPLYVGGNTGDSQRFCTRVGDLIADMHGLWDGGTGHHSGGQSLYAWCKNVGVHPGDLWIAWAARRPWCGRCAEIELLTSLLPTWEDKTRIGLLNKNRPPACDAHQQRVP